MTTYNIALKDGVDYDEFWHEIETDGRGSIYIPNRAVDIVNERPTSLRQCWYDLTNEEAEKLRNDSRVYCVEIPPEFRTDIVMKHHSSQTGIYSKLAGTPDPYWVNWGLPRMNSTTDNTHGNVGFFTYNYPLDGTGVDVVIQDSGAQIIHPEFRYPNGQSRVQQIDWYAASGIPGTMPLAFYTDHVGHGTHVTGIAAGLTYGRAKNAHIYIMTLAGLCAPPTNGINVTQAFDLIKGWHNNKPIDPVLGYKRPSVVNMSWGYANVFASIYNGVYRGVSWTGTTKQTQYGMIGNSSGYFGVRVDSIDVDVAELLAAGVILVGAAGNYYQTIDNPGGLDYDNYFYQAGSSGGLRYYMRGSSPTAVPGVICVGAVDIGFYGPEGKEQKAAYSESGPRVDLYAPGTQIVSALSQYYVNAFIYYPYGVQTYPYDSGFMIANISGTSMASPNVAGIAAQLLQVYPTATPAQIRQKIIDMAQTNMLYSTGSSTDYAVTNSLHGGPNRFAYQSFNTATNSSSAGPVIMANTTLRS